MKPVILCILDGWGEGPADAQNAIAMAHTPVWDRLKATYPSTQLETSGLSVGLPEGQMGNSEVGHMTMGLGRVVLQDLPRIDQVIAGGNLAHRLTDFTSKVKRCHLMGLLSPGGVHSHQRHLQALAEILMQNGIEVCIHAFLDGRDTAPQSALEYVRPFKLTTLSGRYYAMDRDKRWERTEKAYQAIAEGQAPETSDFLETIQSHYAQGITDEFIPPHRAPGYKGIQDGDGLLMVNFRADRVRQLLSALLLPDFHTFTRPRRIRFAATLGMSPYADDLTPYIPALFERHPVDHSLGEIVSTHGLKQLRIAETEKYAHVTFFFNGGREVVFPGEERLMIPSPKVATYDLCPEMSAVPLTDKLVEAIQSQRFAMIVANYANTDMVGHTGAQAAVISAVEAVDQCLGRLETACLEVNATLLITADHGNAEQMYDPKTGGKHTAHTCNPVPFLLINGPDTPLRQGALADVAPTILTMMEIAQPAVMTGKPLFGSYRSGVGIMLVNKQGLVFVGQRRDFISDAWQMPQGGIDAGEEPLVAALRELKEEIGTDHVRVIAESKDWLVYNLPEDLQGKLWNGQHKGQRQKWFLMEFLGNDTDIHMDTAHPEFRAWKWVRPEEVVQLIVPFKRALYQAVLDAFRTFL